MAKNRKVAGRWIDRRTAAELVSTFFFPVSKRVIERWPIRGRMLNGKILLHESDVLAYAEQQLNAAPATAPLHR